jgi:hypothetical protein
MKNILLTYFRKQDYINQIDYAVNTNNLNTFYQNINSENESSDDNDTYDNNDDFNLNLSSSELLLLHKKIHPNFEISIFEAIIAINAFVERFNLSKKGTTYLLKLLHFLFPNNFLPKTEERLSKLIKTNNSVEIQTFDNSDSFTQCKLAPQIVNFIKQYHENIGMTKFDEHHEIVSSEYYKEKKLLQRQPSLNLMISSDGISVSNSTINHTWPVIFSLIEVPSNLKASIKNCFVSGIF